MKNMAKYKTTSEIIEKVKKDFDLEIDRQMAIRVVSAIRRKEITWSKYSIIAMGEDEFIITINGVLE